MSVLAKHERLFSGPCTEAQFTSPAFQQWIGQFGDWGIGIHRKLWEWAYITQALYERDMLQPGKRGLGFAVGKEPLSALFARHGCTIVATDLFMEQAQQSDWVQTHQHAASLEALNERGICDPTRFRELVSFRAVDMNAIPEDLVGFDFVWSSCSIEHLGSIERGLRFIRNAMRCLKPGGYAVHTTEFNVSSNTTTLEWDKLVLFRRSDLERVAAQLRAEGHEVALTFEMGNGQADRYVDRPPYQHKVHLKLAIGEYVATSYGLIIRKRPDRAAKRPAPQPARAAQAAPLGVPAPPSETPADALPEARVTPIEYGRLISSPCTEAQLRSPAFQQWVGQFGDWGVGVHRRLWEWAYITQALHERDMIQPGRRGLGFTAGKEPLSALFATYGCTIVATDLFSQQTSQPDVGAESLSELGFREAEQFPEPVSFRAIDMNAIPEDLAGFDFVWSSCSIQQLGSIERGLRFIRNVMRCLRPGGYAVHTTEFNVSSNTATLETHDLALFRRSDLERIAAELRTEGHEVELSFDTGTGEADRYIDRPPYQHKVHLKLAIGEYVATSYGLIIRKRPAERAAAAGMPAQRPRGPLSELLPEVPAAQTGVSAADVQLQVPAPPAAHGMLASGPCTEAQLMSPTFQRWVVRFGERGGWLHRKLWEWGFITQALYERDLLQPGTRGLGFAVGSEPLSALFASHGSAIVATDLFAEQAQKGGWVDTNQHAASLESLNKHGLCEPARFRELVSFRAVDMNAIPQDLVGFDFVWSSCSLEHLGSIERGLRFIRNAMRCLKPGGYAVHTTELNVSSNTTTLETEGLVLFRRSDLERVAAQLRAEGHQVELHFDMGGGQADRHVDRPPYQHDPHLKLEIGEYVATSYGLIIRKRAAAGRPAGQADREALSAPPEVPAAPAEVPAAADTQPEAAGAPTDTQPETPSAPEPPAETPALAQPEGAGAPEPQAEIPADSQPDTAAALSSLAVAQMTNFEQIRQQTMNHTITERIIEIPWALMQLPQSGLILDIGSCDATYLRVIHQPGRLLHCLDPRDCRGEIPSGAVFYNQSLIGNDLPGKTYDAVLLISTLEHIGLPCYGQTPFPDGDRMALAEAWRLLKPEGVLIVTVPVGQAKIATWYRQYSPAALERLFAGWRTSISYWGFDGRHYQPITADQAARYDYRDSPYIGAGAGAIAGIVAYPK